VATKFRADYSVETRIKFIGVFDTVGALGNPLFLNGGRYWVGRNKFHDLKLSRSVDFAYHAVAVDGRRRKFEAALWEAPTERVAGQVIEQVWFAGTHSNVGGGYGPDQKRPALLSDNALRWMADKAQAAGLDLKLPELTLDPMALVNESRKGIYRLWRPYLRPIGTRRYKDTTVVVDRTQYLHESLSTRYGGTVAPLYRPFNLDDHFPPADQPADAPVS
jgi:hypothetical protein